MPQFSNVRTYSAVLLACSNLATESSEGKVNLRLLETGMSIHSRAKAAGFDTEAFLANSLVEMYVKCGSLTDARRVFDGLELHTVVTWTALMLGYLECGEAEVALELFTRMDCEADAQAFVAGLRACSELVALQSGKGILSEIYRCGAETDARLANSLVDMYSKCGSMTGSQLVFDSLAGRSNVAWNSLMGGYGQLGDVNRVLLLLQGMVDEGVEVNEITFFVVLSACSHAGMVYEGRRLFERMRKKFGVSVGAQHYSCMVDLLGRANRLDEALELLRSMPVEADWATWLGVLAACWRWRNVVIGEVAFQSLVGLDCYHPAPYVLMSNIYEAQKLEF